jgi:hypothetical protein
MPARDIESVAIAGDRILAVAYWHDDEGPPGSTAFTTCSRCGMGES